MIKIGDICEIIGGCCSKSEKLYAGEQVTVRALLTCPGAECYYCLAVDPIGELARIEYADGIRGWVPKKYLRKLPGDDDKVSDEVWDYIGWSPKKELDLV